MRALPVAAAMVVGSTISAAAQMIGPDNGYPGAAAAPDWNSAPPAPPPRRPPCFNELTPIRVEAKKHAEVLKAAMLTKAPHAEVCSLIKRFSAAEAEVVRFVTTNAQSCGIPAEAVTAMKANHDRTVKVETQICNAAVAPQRPTGPGLREDPPPHRFRGLQQVLLLEAMTCAHCR
jgi:hypothetical protein